MWSLYKHVSPSGKVYVGISSNIPIRNNPIDIDSIKDTILSSIKSRKMNRLNKRQL